MARSRRGVFGKLLWKAEWKIANYLWSFAPIRYFFLGLAILGMLTYATGAY